MRQTSSYVSTGNTCNATFAILKNVRSPGPATIYQLPSVNQCLNQCLSLENCMVVEFTSRAGNCSIPVDVNSINTKMLAPGTDQIVITSRCAAKGKGRLRGFCFELFVDFLVVVF